MSKAARQRWTHVKRGTTYEVIGIGELQMSADLVDGSSLVIYRGDDGKLWAREEGEFLDGRFKAEPVSDRYKFDPRMTPTNDAPVTVEQTASRLHRAIDLLVWTRSNRKSAIADANEMWAELEAALHAHRLAALASAPAGNGAEATIPIKAFPERIGQLCRGERLSDGEDRICAGGCEQPIPAGHAIYWPERLGEYPDDMDPSCILCAINRSEREQAWCVCNTPDPDAALARPRAAVETKVVLDRETIAAAILKAGIPGGSTFDSEDRREMAEGWADAIVALNGPRAAEGEQSREQIKLAIASGMGEYIMPGAPYDAAVDRILVLQSPPAKVEG